jgi:hypothetical protein
VICIGGSHTNAIALAVGDAERNIYVINLRNFTEAFVRTHETLTLRPDILDLIRSRNGPVFSFVGGNRHNRLGLVKHPRPFDFVLPGQPDLPLDPNAEIVPFDAVRNALERESECVLQQIWALSEQCGGSLTQVESPPPAVEAKILEHPGKSREYIRSNGVAYSMMRLRLWRVYCMIVRSFCERIGLRYLPAPPESMDAAGFLLPELTRNATHGNGKYGALVLQQLELAAA